jgi:Tol biopolymer transport system component
LASKAEGEEAMYRVGFKCANLLKVSLVTSAAMLAITLLTLGETTSTAEATSLPRNGKIAFSSHGIDGGDHDIYTVEPDGSNISRLTNDSTYEDYRPSWSPDGKTIIFEREGVGSGSHSVMVMDANGWSFLTNIRKLPTRAISTNFNWSPDGTKLTFTRGEPPNYDIHDIYTMDPDSSGLINLTKTPGIDEQYPDFSPDGSQLCYFRSGYSEPSYSRAGIYVMKTNGSNPSRLSAEEGPATPCDWSPDGTKIAFSSIYDSGDSTEQVSDEEVYVINADGSGRTNLTTNSVSDLHPEWSPDGTKITFVSYMGGVPSPEVYTMNADGSDVARVTKNPDGEDIYPSWQPLPPPDLNPIEEAFAKLKALLRRDGARTREAHDKRSRPAPPKDADSSDVDQVTKKPGGEGIDRDRPERTVVVKPGDSLWSISEERLGPEASPQRVYDHTTQLYTLNRKRIGSDPNLIFPQQKLLLPLSN